MPAGNNQPWDLESFVDSFIVELDKAQDTLAVKGVTRKLTYTVKDVALDLHIFPRYENGGIRFVTAQPGESSASRLSIQLGSISDRQIRESTQGPLSKDDVSIELIDELDEETRDTLRKVGISSGDDLERMEKRNVDVEKILRRKEPPGKRRSYKDLANLINKARRKEIAPRISRVQLDEGREGRQLSIEGDNLVLSRNLRAFPLALLDDQPIEVVRASDREVRMAVPEGALRSGSSQLKIALDPYALVTLEVKS